MHCLACREPVERFESYGLPPRNGRCPRCGAKPRHRATLWYLAEVLRPRLSGRARVLEVGASKVALARHAAALAPAEYLAIDLRRLSTHEPLAAAGRFARMDVSRLGFPDAGFDLILCNHTLSYVRDDRGALAELRRCLAPSGLLMLEVPVGAGPTVPAAARRRALSRAWFAENGDAWIYGEDFDDRVRAAGLWARLDELFADWSPAARREAGLKPRHRLRVAFRDRAGAERFPPPGPSSWASGGPS